jgi:hypothetical protein
MTGLDRCFEKYIYVGVGLIHIFLDLLEFKEIKVCSFITEAVSLMIPEIGGN